MSDSPMRWTRRTALTAGGVLFLAACTRSGSDDTDSAAAGQPATDDLPATTADEISPPETAPTPPPVSPNTSFVAESTINGTQLVYESPGGEVKTDSLQNPTSIGAPLVFLVKEDLGDWLEVYLPIRPNGSSGFVRAGDVRVTSHVWSIVVELSAFVLTVYKDGEVFKKIDIAVAAANTPTPGGLYYTTELLQPTNDAGEIDPTGLYGTYAYGLSGFSEVFESFNGGPGQLGIHGTNQPELIGQNVSAGCIRMRNDDIDQLAPILPLGVPVEVIA